MLVIGLNRVATDRRQEITNRISVNGLNRVATIRRQEALFGRKMNQRFLDLRPRFRLRSRRQSPSNRRVYIRPVSHSSEVRRRCSRSTRCARMIFLRKWVLVLDQYQPRLFLTSGKLSTQAPLARRQPRKLVDFTTTRSQRRWRPETALRQADYRKKRSSNKKFSSDSARGWDMRLSVSWA